MIRLKSIKHKYAGFFSEIPVILFFIYLFYILFLRFSKNFWYSEFVLIYDHWWYFHDRLMDGSFAQWNPFVQLGRVAVLFNEVPVSIFTPILLLTKCSPESFRLCAVIGCFLANLSIYIFARSLGYKRYISMVPILILNLGGFIRYTSFIEFNTYFFFYPLAIIFLIYGFETKKSIHLIGFVALLSLSFLGMKLEYVQYTVVFVFLCFLCFAYCKDGVRSSKKRIISYILLCILVVGSVLSADSWYICMLVYSVKECGRIAVGIDWNKFADLHLWKYIFFSIFYQIPFVIICINILALCVFRKRLRTSIKKINIYSAFIFLGLELLIIKALYVLLNSCEPYQYVTSVYNSWDFQKESEILLSWSGIAAMVFSVFAYYLRDKEHYVRKTVTFFIFMFAGFYISEYSWQTWAMHGEIQDRIYFFASPFFASLFCLGTINLWLKNKQWIVVVLVIYHLIGETVSFVLIEVFGIYWLVSRAFYIEMPFQAIVILESVLFIMASASYFTEQIFVNINLLKLRKIVYYAFGLTGFISVFVFIYPVLMPTELNANGDLLYKRQIPFDKQLVTANGYDLAKVLNGVINETKQLSTPQFCPDSYLKNRLQRIHVDHGVHEIMSSRLQALNMTTPYGSELPLMLRYIISGPSKTNEWLQNRRKWHLEMNPLFYAYNNYSKPASGQVEAVSRYMDMIMLPFWSKGAKVLPSAIAAEEGTDIPRFFMSNKVLKFPNMEDEYNFLQSQFSKNERISEIITTSDDRFPSSTVTMNNGEFRKDVDSACSYELIKDLPEYIELSVKSDSDVYLSVMDLWSSGWTAYVDGIQTPIYRGYIGTRFIKVNKGVHRIEFKFCIPGFVLCSVLSIATWIILIVLSIYIIKKKKIIIACYNSR